MAHWIAFIVLPVVVGIFSTQHSSAQPPLGHPKFEVAAIKPSAAGGNEKNAGIQPSSDGRLTITDMTLLELIAVAYEVRDSQILGGPKWVRTDRYDVVGKAEGKVSSLDEIRQIIQSLFADRFNMAVHYETRELPVYALTVAKGGIKFQQTKEGSCTTFDPDRPPVATQAQRPKFCGTVLRKRGSLNAIAIGITKPDGGTMGLANVLSQIMDQTIIDKTGLTGLFDFHLEWAPDPATTGPLGSEMPRPGQAIAARQRCGPINIYCASGTTRVEARIGQGSSEHPRDRSRRAAVGELVGVKKDLLWNTIGAGLSIILTTRRDGVGAIFRR
jgi:uncharacterized protein (TIGR03435 family)